MSVNQYIALGLVLFNKKKYGAFIKILEEAKRTYPDTGVLELHQHDTIGRFQLKTKGLLPLEDYDLHTYWFNRRFNADSTSLNFKHGKRGLRLLDHNLEMKRELIVDVTVNKNRTIDLVAGPFHISRGYDQVSLNNFMFDESILFEYIEKLRAETLKDDERAYFTECAGEENIELIQNLFDSHLNEETQKAIDEAEVESLNDSETEDILAFLDAD